MAQETEELVDVLFYGELRKKYGRKFRFAISSPRELSGALSQLPGFREWVLERLNTVRYRVLVGEQPRTEQDFAMPIGSARVIKIVPVVCGSKDGTGGMKVVGGMMLIVLGSIVSGASYGAAAPIGAFMISYGISMMIDGMSTLMTKTPSATRNPEDPSRDGSNKGTGMFSGPINTIAQGVCIPVGYGKLRVGGRVYSASSAVVSYPTGAYGGAFFGGDGAGGSTGNGDTEPLTWSIDPV